MPRNKHSITIRVCPDLLDRLDAWREQQAAEPSRTATIEAALRQFLDAAAPITSKRPRR